MFVSKLTLFLVKPQSSQYNTNLFWIYIYIWLLFDTFPSKLRYSFFSFLGFLLAPRPVYDENYTKWISPSHFYIAKMFVKHIFKASNKGCFYWIFYSYILILVKYIMGPNIKCFIKSNLNAGVSADCRTKVRSCAKKKVSA